MALSSWCFITRFSLEAFLVLEKIFKYFLYNIWAWRPLFNDAVFEKIDMPSTKGLTWNLVKICQAVSEKTFKDFIHVYSTGARADSPGGQNVDYNWKGLLLWSYFVSFSHWSLIHYEKLNFQYFPPYKCIGTQIRPCCKKVKCQPKVIIWTWMALNSWCYITRFSVDAFLVLEKIFFKVFFTISGHGSHLVY